MKNPLVKGGFFIDLRDYFDIFGLWTFLAGTFSEGDCLAFFQCFETIALDAAKVHEQVSTAIAANESISLAFVKPLNGTGDFVRHCSVQTFVE
jgi:hypothetical protein